MPRRSKRVVEAERKQAEIVLRRTKALDLRIAGRSYRAIAEELEIGLTQAYDDVQNALAEARSVEREKVEELRALELARLDVALEGLFPAVRKGNPLAVDRLLKISERRAKLCDLDAPVRHDFSGLTLEEKAVLANQLLARALERKSATEERIDA